MKSKLILQILVMLILASTAQAQQGINYKAIIHDDLSDVLANTLVVVQFTILENGTTNVFQETHSQTTDAHGILIVNIGEGTPLSGDFNTIEWGSNPHFLKTEIDFGAGYTDMGTAEFKTVPYALYAENGSGAKELNDLIDAKFDGSSLFVGQGAGTNDDGNNGNSANGVDALYSNTSGWQNTANGVEALYSNTAGCYNSANGYGALYSNTTGHSNTANGYFALYNNTIATSNTANGGGALTSNTTGNYNTANGYAALRHNSVGESNTANGYAALYYNRGSYNTANGVEALHDNTTGICNTAIGYQALYTNTAGQYNTTNGFRALYLSTGENNTAIGSAALAYLTEGDNNIAIGYDAQVPNSTGSNQVRIGNEDITYAGIQVAWTVTSDMRWKEDIRSLPYGLDMLMKLKPVDYIRKNNEKDTREMGIIAQDLEKVLDEMGYEDQGLLLKDDNGYLHLRYNDLIALLTKAIQDQQAIINSQNERLELQENKISYLDNEVEQLDILQYRLELVEETLKNNL